MSATDTSARSDDGLDRLGAGGGAVLALFLLLGSVGHLGAVWPLADGASMIVLLPGLLLLAAGALNAAAAPALWRGRRRWQWLLVVVNAMLAIYLAWLLSAGLPDHPIGVFLALVLSQLVVLVSALAGLEWRTLET